MFEFILKKIFGTKNERELKKLQPIVSRINELERAVSELSDEELKAKTPEFKERIDKGESLDDLLPEAFAVVREVAKRTLGMRHFDVQLMGGIVLHQGKIAEMKTGEGKTLVATLPVYLNALTGRGVHVVTVNDYLARRDAEWMGPIYRFLGLTVGVIVHGLDDSERKKAYACDVTYGTNNEFGFDYLRDNMKYSIEDCVQRELFYAIVDEVDSILIDEARTPLIISGPSEESPEKYYRINRIIPFLKRDKHFRIDEKLRTVILTEEGVEKVEELLRIDNLYDPRNIEILHHVNQALKAHHLFKRDVDYVLKDSQVVIVDEFTGRLMPGRRWSDGLHQAIEAKEGVRIESENQTLATITFQNYFRMYKKLAGMTGTAETEAVEFQKIYNLDVVVIPTHKPMIRIDYPDVIYRTEKEKFRAVVREVKELYRIGRPVLIGTTSIEKSERLSEMLKREGIPHQVLNAKHHEKEALIIAQAGRFKAVTVATNMAGRGVDIILGGNPPDPVEQKKVIELGGLHIIGTERHEARRIDNQLRGRSGRQGDPGSSRFYLSLEDDLMRIFGSDRLSSFMEKLGMEEDQPIEHHLVTKAIENAQRRVEAHNFEIRKHLLEYDNVMNKQREVVYEYRRKIMGGEDLKKKIFETIDELVEDAIDHYLPEDRSHDEWDLKGLADRIYQLFGINIGVIEGWRDKESDEINGQLLHLIKERYDERERSFSPPIMRYLEKVIMLHTMDNLWKDHLLAMDHLKEGIGLRGYAQKDPLVEYQREAFDLFSDMIERWKESVVERIFKVQITKEEDIKDEGLRRTQRYHYSRGEEPAHTPVRRNGKKVGRNDPCPCGSGKKYKKCCGRN